MPELSERIPLAAIMNVPQVGDVTWSLFQDEGQWVLQCSSTSLFNYPVNITEGHELIVRVTSTHVVLEIK